MRPVHPTSLTTEILMFLAHCKGVWATWGASFYMPSVQQVFPVGTAEKDQLEFMQALQKKGLVGGCDCACRGDYVLTELGLEMLAKDCEIGERKVKEFMKNGYHRFGY